MKQYIITIIGATLLSALASILSPEKWRGYTRIITGLVIISCIISPLATLARGSISLDLDKSFERVSSETNVQTELIEAELKKRINADIEARMKQEFGITVSAASDIRVNDDGGVEGVDAVYIRGARLSATAVSRICEVYGIKPQEVHNE